MKSSKSQKSKKHRKNGQKPRAVISGPIDVIHEMHVDYNSETGFTGLPPEWEVLLKKAGLVKAECISHSEDVLTVLKFMTDIQGTRPTDLRQGTGPKDIVNMEIQDEDPTSKLKNMTKNDEDSTCTVYSAEYNGQRVAVKEMQLNEKNEKSILQETRLMTEMRHENILGFLGAFRKGNMLWIIMEYMDSGSLTKVANYCEPQEPQEPQEPHIAYFTREILKGLQYMHSHRKIHSDIKTDNILLHKDGSVKLADFGYSCELDSETSRRKSIVGTPYWMIPEVIR
jgi:serine/threonine protein kinase